MIFLNILEITNILIFVFIYFDVYFSSSFPFVNVFKPSHTSIINQSACLFADTCSSARSGFILRHGGRSGGAGHGDGVSKTPGTERHWSGPGWAAQHLRGLKQACDHEENIASRYLLFINDQISACATVHTQGIWLHVLNIAHLLNPGILDTSTLTLNPIHFALRWPYGTRTATTTSLLLWDGGTDGESASGAATRSAAWRGGGAGGRPWDGPATPPPAARHRHREPASSLSVDRTRARGERRGRWRSNTSEADFKGDLDWKITTVYSFYCFFQMLFPQYLTPLMI